MVERVYLFACELGIGQTLSGHLGHEESEAIGIVKRILFRSTVVESKHLFVEVAVKMERLYSNVGSSQGALKQRPEVIQSLGVYLPSDVFLRMVNYLVDKVVAKMIVPYCGIGVDLTTAMYAVQNFVLQSLSLNVRDDLRANLPKIAVKHPEHGSLAYISIAPHLLAPPLVVSCLAALVHLIGVRSYKGFIAFDWPTLSPSELETTFISHSFTDTMQHEPCRVLANAESLSKFIATNSILAVSQHPKRNHPLIKSKRGVFHDSSHLDRELLLADVAEPETARLDKRVLGLSAARARYISTWPAEPDSGIESALRVAEVGDCTLQSLEAFHA